MIKKLLIAISIQLLIVNVAFSGAWLSGEESLSSAHFDYRTIALGVWYMDQDTTAAETDETANGNNLTVTGGGLPTSATVPTGYSGASRDFERGDGDYLSQADAGGLDINGATDLTACLWWDPESISNDMTLMSDGGTGAGDRAWYLEYKTATNKFQMNMSTDGTALATAISTTGAVVDTYIHVCAVYNQTDIRIYINGALDNNGTDNPKTYSGGIHNNSDPFYIGSNGGQHSDGEIDEALFDDAAYTAAQILEIYTYGTDGTKGAND